MTKTITGGEVIAGMLAKEGVRKIFGIVDGTYLSLCVSLNRYGMDLVTPRHEATAAHMAGAYARMTGGLGICIASNGPGVANVLSGATVENAEGNRVLVITSSRRTGISYPDRGGAYQYLDQVAAMKPISKGSWSVSGFARIQEIMRRALRMSYRGRPGVVHVDVPEDVINGKGRAEPLWEPRRYRKTDRIVPAADLVERAAAYLAEAELPLIHGGSGVIHSSAFDELARLSDLLHAPVTTSWSGRGVLPETSELSWPMVHVKACNELRKAADVVLCLGSRLGETDWWGKPPYWAPAGEQRLIQVDADEEILGMNRPADLPVLADVKEFLGRLLEALAPRRAKMDLDARRERVRKLAEAKMKNRTDLDKKLDDASVPMVTAHVGKVCSEVFQDDAIVVFDGGNTAVWGIFYYPIRAANTQLGTHHFGMLGAGVGQALGAAVARPERQVFCIIGDGAFGFHPQEIETAVRHGLKVVFLVCCDRQWGMVKMNQQFALKPLKTMIKKSLGPGETFYTDLGEIAFDKLAHSMGGHGERVADPAELRAALERSLDSGKCAVIHVDVDPVKHMWAPGLIHFKKMHQEPGGK